MSHLSGDFVIPARPESFLQKDSRSASGGGVTEKEKDNIRTFIIQESINYEKAVVRKVYKRDSKNH
jgi:hypothetical protein